MYKIIVYYKDKKNFGNQIIIYKSENNYLVIIDDRGEISYSFVDNDIKKCYPVNSYMKKIGFNYNIKAIENNIEIYFDIDLSKYGHYVCPDYLKNLIQNKQKKN